MTIALLYSLLIGYNMRSHTLENDRIRMPYSVPMAFGNNKVAKQNMHEVITPIIGYF